MRLSEFIRRNEERILQDWEDFARELVSAPAEMGNRALRDHAQGMLRCIAHDLERAAGAGEPGAADRMSPGGAETAAHAHGGDRKEWGFSVVDMVAEFRALRRSVTAMWGEQEQRMASDDMIRFNEIIDRELAESLNAYTAGKEQQTRLLEALLRHTSDQSAVLGLDGCILYANRAMARAHGEAAADLVGRGVDALDPVVAHEMRRQLQHVQEGREELRSEIPLTAPDGELTVTEYLFAPIVDGERRIEAIAVTARDITERKALEGRLWRHANHDPLTGVPNRRLFFDRLEQDMRLAKRNDELLALLYVDLDRFKAANDRLGHEAGDELLQQVTARVGACIRETDTLARVGGDEFTVILMGVGDAEHAQTVAQLIVEQLSRPFAIGHETARIGASVGVAFYPEHGETVNDLVAHADLAMYEAKHDGGARARLLRHEDMHHARANDAARELRVRGKTRH